MKKILKLLFYLYLIAVIILCIIFAYTHMKN